MREFADLKKFLSSKDSEVNNKIIDLQSQVNSRTANTKGQEQFFEALASKERKCNVIVLGIPEDQGSVCANNSR